MKNTFICPKCQSRDVIEIAGSSMNTQTMVPLSKWGLKNAVIDRYICIICGYTEEYVRITDSIKKYGKKILADQKGLRDDYV